MPKTRYDSETFRCSVSKSFPKTVVSCYIHNDGHRRVRSFSLEWEEYRVLQFLRCYGDWCTVEDLCEGLGLLTENKAEKILEKLHKNHAVEKTFINGEGMNYFAE